MYNANLLIDNDIIEQSQEICKFITDPVVRNRAVANVVSAKTVLSYFTDMNVDITSGLHNIPQILKSWEISDIYVNNAYIDVRVYFNQDEMYVPKYHFNYGLLPVAYMFIKLEQDLSGATVIGFIDPQNIDTTSEHGDYYKVEEDSLVSFYDIQTLISEKEPVYFENLEQLLYGYLDSTPEEQVELSAYLLKSQEARLKLVDISNAKNVFAYISIDSAINVNYEESESDYVLEDNELGLAVDDNVKVIDFNIDAEQSEFNNIIENSEDYLTNSIEENSNLDLVEFSTEVEPSINEIESHSELVDTLELDEENIIISEQTEPEGLRVEDLEDNNADMEFSDVKDMSEDTPVYNDDSSDSNINSLFDSENEDNPVEPLDLQIKKKNNNLLPILGLLVIIGALGYYGFSKFSLNNQATVDKNATAIEKQSVASSSKESVAMPVESVENIDNNINEVIENSFSLPEIENNLDASIIVSNLSVKWEVPVSYVSNVTAKRYFTKIGKIIQMNLKTELLLLSKIPISNKITLNLEFDKSLQKFKVKEVITTSGEEQIDNIIKKSVNNVLNNSFNFNMKVFNDLQGNPTLLINL